LHLIKDSAAPLFVALLVTGCQQDREPVQPPAPDPEPAASTCGELGTLQASLSGAISAEIDWPDRALRCESMLRPDDRGVRLRLSGTVGGERLSVIIAMPELEADATGEEFDAVVTITVEGSGRFFSTPNLGSCWADVQTNAPLDDGSGLYNVAGNLSCVAPLGEFNGDAFVDVQRLSFSGVADWSAS
jgi:hypothetical protein